MKEIYVVLYHSVEHHYGELREHTSVDGIFEDKEDAKAYIQHQMYPSEYELVDWIDYYEAGAKEKFGW